MKQILFALTLLVIGASNTASATSLELSKSKTETLEIFLNNLPELTVKNSNGDEHAEFPVAKMFAESLAASRAIGAYCTYRTKTLIEDCSIYVTEGNGGEGVGGVLRVYKFTVVHGKITSKSIEVFGAL